MTSLTKKQGLTLGNIDLPEVQSVIDFLKPATVTMEQANQFIKGHLDGRQKTKGESGKKDTGADAVGGGIRPARRAGREGNAAG